MSWIALKMLTGDRAKFFGIVLGLTFAALLITQQGSIFCGLMRRTAGQVEDITGADLWVMDKNVRFIDDVKPMLETSLYRVRGVEGVRWAVPLYKGNARLKLKTTDAQGRPIDVIEQVILLGVDDSSMVGAPPPRRMVVGSLTDLRQTDAIVIDYNRLAKLYPGEPWKDLPESPEDPAFARFYARFVGREVEMNDRRGVIVGVCEATRTFQSNPVVYTTYSRAKQYVPRERKLLSYVLAQVDSDASEALTPAERAELTRGLKAIPYACATLSGRGSRWLAEAEAAALKEKAAERVARRISLQTGLKARTSNQFFWDTVWYYFQYTGIPINFGITIVLGFIIGTAIAGQTFYNFTIENLKQFGSLKAMGASNLKIGGMIILQAMVVGLLGFGLGVGLAAWFGVSSRGGELAYFMPWQLLPITAGSILIICILSSILSVRKVVVLEPAIVFRG